MSNRFLLLLSLLFWAARMTSAQIVAVDTADPDGATYLGCFVDNPLDLLLAGPTTASPDMTIEVCHSFCVGLGYYVFGVEDGDLCFCGYQTTGNEPAISNDCDISCSGEPSEICGGLDAISLYNDASTTDPLDATFLGCFDDSNSRLLDGVSISSTTLTIETCHTFCQEQNYALFGLEVGVDCFCADVFAYAPASNNPCSWTCGGDRKESCGGYLAIGVYNRTVISSTSSTSAFASSTFSANVTRYVPKFSTEVFAYRV